MAVRKCNTCQIDQPQAEYEPRRAKCRSCRNEAAKRRYYKLAGEDKEARSKWLQRNTDRYAVVRAAHKRWPEQELISRLAYAKLLDVGKCFYCGLSLPPFGTALDRTDSSEGYTEANVVLCCTDCNRTKSNVFSKEEMLLIGRVIRKIKLRRRDVSKNIA